MVDVMSAGKLQIPNPPDSDSRPYAHSFLEEAPKVCNKCRVNLFRIMLYNRFYFLAQYVL